VVVVDRVDLDEVHELFDVDRLRGLRIERLELLRRDQHVAIGRYLISLDDLLERYLLIGGGIDPLLLDPRAGLGGELVKADRLRRGCAVQLDGHVDQPEADRARPNRTGHIRFV